ncbi:hypothetical protein BX666DRAFT_186361 [Dichotomocladium elegans]|nr:hypothetical protein BX666DRAFT_186361 [Dichotomocladium elegans]
MSFCIESDAFMPPQCEEQPKSRECNDQISPMNVQNDILGAGATYSQLKSRQEQSEQASKLIAEKLLLRWILLSDICVNETCYACVVCGYTYDTPRTEAYDTLSASERQKRTLTDEQMISKVNSQPHKKQRT